MEMFLRTESVYVHLGCACGHHSAGQLWVAARRTSSCAKLKAKGVKTAYLCCTAVMRVIAFSA